MPRLMAPESTGFPVRLGWPEAPPPAPPAPSGYIGNTYLPDYEDLYPPAIHQAHPGLNPDNYGPAVSLPPEPALPPVAPPPNAGNIGNTYLPNYDDVMNEGVRRADMPPLAAPPWLDRIAAMMSGAGHGQQLSPPPSRRYSLGIPKTDFIYTNPVAAQQAAASLSARLGYEQQQDQGYRQYLIAQEQARQANANQAQRLAENEKDRALKREGFASSERSAANRAYGYSDFDRRQAAREKELAEQKLISDRANYRQAVALANALNSSTVPPMQKNKTALANPGLVNLDPSGRYVPSMPNPDLAAPGVTTIGQLQSGIAARQQQIRDAATPPPAYPQLNPPVALPAPESVPWYQRWFGHPTAPLQAAP